jgi:hypothetical protein
LIAERPGLVAHRVDGAEPQAKNASLDIVLGEIDR